MTLILSCYTPSSLYFSLGANPRTSRNLIIIKFAYETLMTLIEANLKEFSVVASVACVSEITHPE